MFAPRTCFQKKRGWLVAPPTRSLAQSCLPDARPDYLQPVQRLVQRTQEDSRSPRIACSLRSESQRSAASSTSVEQPSTPAASPQRMAAAADLQPAFSAGSFDLEWAQNVTPEPQASLAAPQHFLLPRQLRMTPQERFLKVLVVSQLTSTALQPQPEKAGCQERANIAGSKKNFQLCLASIISSQAYTTLFST